MTNGRNQSGGHVTSGEVMIWLGGWVVSLRRPTSSRPALERELCGCPVARSQAVSRQMYGKTNRERAPITATTQKSSGPVTRGCVSGVGMLQWRRVDSERARRQRASAAQAHSEDAACHGS